jgi:WD40 repeat protein/DNA-binding SARP family transcriptional activator/energy-coupling factor transporter ATP-binding protein EcfA2
VQFRILGPLEVLDDDGRPLVLGGAKQRALLAILLLHPGQVVSADRLIDELWGEDPPDTARSVLQVYVANLRKLLEPGRPKRTASSFLRTQPPGYLLDLGGHGLDLDHFEQLVDEGRAGLAAGQASQATTLLRAALGLWRGPALGDVALLGRGQGALAQLEERRLAALEERIQADLALGRHRELVGELEGLVAEYPLRERLWAQLMLALYRSGRQADALAAFQRARDKLVEELGIEPGAELRALEAQVLAQDARLAAPRLALPELPAPLAEVGPTFVDREKELAWLGAGLERAAAGRGVLRLVEGPAGAGKTRLAAELARLAQDRRIPVRYAAGPAIPAEVAAEPDAEAGPSRVALLVLDDLDAVEPLPLDAIQRLLDTGPPVLVVGTYDPDGLSSVQRAALDQLVLAGAAEAERRSLPALAIGDVAEIIRRYAVDADHAEVRALADRLAEAPPGQIHQAASAWAIQRATGKVGTAVAQLPAPQRAAQGAREDLVAGVLGLQHARTQRTAEGPAPAGRLPVCPYKGLAAYGPDDAAYFVGRERLVAEALARLVGAELLAVVGPSGSGKSSLVRAGLLPALAAGTLPGSQRWRQVVLTPGDRPAEVLDRALADLPDEGRTVLVVDQLEELFTLAGAGQRVAFVDRLVEALRSPYADVVAVVTLRSDYYGHCADHSDLAKLVQATTVLVGALRPQELGRAIEVPAELVGLEVEPGVTEAILADAADQPGALPLVSTALLALWEHRAGRRLTLAGYAQTGGVRGAVAQLADRIYDGFDTRQQAITRAILLRLTEPGEGRDDVRRRARRNELGDDEATTKVLSTLVGRRLLIADEQTVEVAHEALLREWPRLRGWLEEDREGRRLHRQLAEAASQWVAHDRDPEQLYRGARLAAALDWAKQHQTDLNEHEHEFLTASSDRHARQLRTARQSARRLRSLAGGLAAVLVLALIAGGIAVAQRSTARRQALLANSGRLAALATERITGQLDLAMLLAVEGHRLDDSVTTRGALLSTVGKSPRLTGLHHEFGANMFMTALSPDGSVLAVCHLDNTLRFWDMPARTPRTAPIHAHGGPLRSCGTFSKDGRIFATGGSDGMVRLWDPANGHPLGTPNKGHEGPVMVPAFSPDGHRLATVGVDGLLRIWNVPSNAPATSPVQLGQISRSVQYSPDGKLLAVGTLEGTVRLLDAKTFDQIGKPLPVPPGDVLSVAFSPDGTLLATATAQDAVILWDVRARTQRGQPLVGHEGQVLSVRFSPDGSTLASGDLAGRVVLWDVDSGTRIGTPLIGHVGPASVAGFTDRGRGLVSSATKEVATWNRQALSLGTQLQAHRGGAFALARSSDGRLVASGGNDGRVRLWDAASRSVGNPVQLPGEVYSLAFSGDGQRLAAAVFKQEPQPHGWVVIWEVATGRRLGNIATGPTWPLSVDFSPDQTTIAAGMGNGEIHRWQAGSLRPHGTPIATEAKNIGVLVRFTPDGKTLVAAVNDKLVLYDMSTGAKVAELAAHTDNITALSISPDGSRAASVGFDGKLILSDLSQRSVLGEPLEGGAGARFGVAFSPNGTTAATVGDDRSVVLWDIATRQRLGSLFGHLGASQGVVFSGDGRTLLTVGDDGNLISWNLVPATWEATACTLAGRNLTQAEWNRFVGGQYRRTCPQWPQG